MQLCAQDLVELTGGDLRLAQMPPLDGELALVRGIVLRADDATADSVYWCFDGRQCAAELAFLRGALGVVAAHSIEPWPGRFSLLVADPLGALERLARAFASGEALRETELVTACRGSKRETRSNLPELKGLQLCAGGGVDIYSPTCGRPPNATVRRCRRRAA
jgi:hypothetical protein